MGSKPQTDHCKIILDHIDIVGLTLQDRKRKKYLLVGTFDTADKMAKCSLNKLMKTSEWYVSMFVLMGIAIINKEHNDTMRTWPAIQRAMW